jgi:hypothetical protein
MSTKQSNQTESPRPYKQKLLIAADLKRQSAELIYDRFRLLNEVFDDQDFRADVGGTDFQWAAELDTYVEDLDFGFLDLRTVFEHFPDRNVWVERKLMDLFIEATQRNAKPDDEPKVKRPRATQAQLKAAEQKAEAADQKVAELTCELEHATERLSEIEILQREVDRLREKLRLAYQRIGELETELKHVQQADLAAA